MRRLPLLFVLLVLATLARAAPFVIVPSYPTGEASFGASPALTMICGRFVMPMTIIGATKLAANVTTGYGVGKKVGMAIYPDNDGASAVASAGNIAADVAQIVTATGLTAFDLTGGVTYRDCWCATSAAGTFANPHWETNGVGILLNSFVVKIGTAANACDANATPPASTGVLSANAAFAPPFLVVSSE